MKKIYIVLFLITLLSMPLCTVGITVVTAEEQRTPITTENQAQLLAEYGMTLTELESLLAQYGETIGDYEFVEELEEAIDFYLHYGDELDFIFDLLAIVGITEEELDRLFVHLSKLDEVELETKLVAIESRMLALSDFESPEDLSEAEREELASILFDLAAAMKLEVRLFLDVNGERVPVTISELIEMNQLHGNLLVVELYDLDGQFILDFVLSDDLFDAGLFKEIGDMLSVLAGISNSYPTGEMLPDTASSYLENIVLGMLLLVLSLFFYRSYRLTGVNE
ncbi:processed acidic surface protein [Bacillus alkalicellulosilyticus]|uniref:processed acidic surface protein n=1 Tax=Alkalihalobacterium alkalicellulosilyticum TaxID=1912214 RepID=UPI000996081B|nr:processed acidic surface protein [Bacillus alkalicellulosilyticus]